MQVSGGRDPRSVSGGEQTLSASATEALRATRSPSSVIVPRKGWLHLDLGEVWKFRELAYFLVWRDVKVRYKQTVVGAAWAVIQPVMLMIIFTFFFGRFARLPTGGIPYPVFYFSALVVWSYFAQAVQMSTQSVISNQSVITKVYFPRLILPIAAVLPGLLDFVMAFFVLVGLMVHYGMPFSARLLFLPLFLLLASLTALGAGVWLSATNALYRDVREGISFLVLLWFFASPVVYPASIIKRRLGLLFGLNPMVGAITGFRWAITGRGASPFGLIVPGMIVATAMLIGGLIYFRRIEDVIIDVV